MRNYPIILSSLILIVFFTTPAKGDELILGTVRSVDRDKGEVLLDLPESPWESLGKDAAEFGKNEPVTVRMPSADLPSSLAPGSVVRVWGNFSAGDRRMFQAEAIRSRPPGTSHNLSPPGGPPFKRDPTGVRGRLQKGRERMGGGRGRGAGPRHR